MRLFLIVLQDAQRYFLQFLTFQEKVTLSLVCRQARYSVLAFDIWDGMMGLVQRQKQTWTAQEEEAQSQQVSTRVRSAIRVRSNINPLALRQPNKPEKPLIFVQPKKQRFLLMPNKDKMQEFYKTNFKGLGKPKQRLEQMTRVVTGWLQQQGQLLKRMSHRFQQLEQLRERKELIDQYQCRVKDQETQQFQAIIKRSESQDFSLKSKYEQFISNLQQIAAIKEQNNAAIQAALALSQLIQRFAKQKVLDMQLNLVREGMQIAGERASLLKSVMDLLSKGLESRELREISDQVQILQQIKGSLAGIQLSDVQIGQAYLKKEVQAQVLFLAELLKYAKFYSKIYLQCQTKRHAQPALEFLKEAGQLQVSSEKKEWLQTASRLVSRVRQELKGK